MSETRWKAVENVVFFSERSIVIKLPVKRTLWFGVYNWQAASCEYKQYGDVVLPSVFRPGICREKEVGLTKYEEIQ